MAAGRPIKPTASTPKRTPKVAGRATPRVTVAKTGEAERETAVNRKVSLAKSESEVSLTKSEDQTPTEVLASGVSGVERKRRVAAEKAAADEAARALVEDGPALRDTAATFRAAAIIGAIALVLGVIATILAVHPGAKVDGNTAFVNRSETDKVLSQARSAACAPFHFDYQNLDGWAVSTRDQFTGGALTEFETFLKTNRSVIEQSKTASECQVDSIGVQDIVGDRATAIATLIVSTTRDGMIADSKVPHVQYTLVSEDGTWRISEVGQF